MFCSNCGKRIPDDSVFCPECGYKLFSATEKMNENSPRQKTFEKSADQGDFSETTASDQYNQGVQNEDVTAASVQGNPDVQNADVTAASVQGNPDVQNKDVTVASVQGNQGGQNEDVTVASAQGNPDTQNEDASFDSGQGNRDFQYQNVTSGSDQNNQGFPNPNNQRLPKQNSSVDSGQKNAGEYQQNYHDGSPAQPRNGAAAIESRRPSKKLLIPIIVAICVAGAFIAFFAVRQFTLQKIDLGEYMTIVTSDIAPKGTAEVSFDAQKFEDTYQTQISSAVQKHGTGQTYFSNTLLTDNSPAAQFFDACSVQASLDKASGLSNGDTVTINWTCDAKTAKKYGFIMNSGSVTRKVTGLDEYLSSAKKQLSKNGVNVLNANAMRQIKEAYSGDEDIQLNKLSYIGNYFYLNDSQNQDEDDIYNALYAVYKGTTETVGGSKVTSYFYLTVTNALCDDSGDLDLKNSLVDSTGCSTFFEKDGYYIPGQENLSTVKNEIMVELGQTLTETNIDKASKKVIYQNKEAASSDNNSDTKDSNSSQTNTTGYISDYSGFIFPESNSRELTDAEIAELDKTQIQEAINEIYARHNYRFEKRQDETEYYEQYTWYTPENNMSEVEAELSTVEKHNVDKLAKARNNM